MRIISKLARIAAVALFATAGAAQAQTTYFGQASTSPDAAGARADFQNALGLYAVGTFFEGSATTSLGILGTVTASGPFMSIGGAGYTADYALTGSAQGSGSATLVFSTALNSFGSDISDLNTCCGGYVQYNFFLGATNVGSYGLTFPDYAATGFYGLTDLASFDSVVIDVSNGEYWELDNVTVGVTPEPASFVLMGTGLLGVIGAARRRKNAK